MLSDFGKLANGSRVPLLLLVIVLVVVSTIFRSKFGCVAIGNGVKRKELDVSLVKRERACGLSKIPRNVLPCLNKLFSSSCWVVGVVVKKTERRPTL